jgi:hypothetical protein
MEMDLDFGCKLVSLVELNDRVGPHLFVFDCKTHQSFVQR